MKYKTDRYICKPDFEMFGELLVNGEFNGTSFISNNSSDLVLCENIVNRVNNRFYIKKKSNGFILVKQINDEINGPFLQKYNNTLFFKVDLCNNLTFQINLDSNRFWRFTGQESYLLFTKGKGIIPMEYINNLEKPELFHEHCSFCWDKVEENQDKKHYCTLDNYHWICNDCYNDFKELLKLEYFEILGKMTHKGMILESLIDDDECFTQIKEYFNLSEVKITDNDLERTLKEMVEEGYISINFKWQNENNEYPYSLTEKGRKVWKEKNNM